MERSPKEKTKPDVKLMAAPGNAGAAAAVIADSSSSEKKVCLIYKLRPSLEKLWRRFPLTTVVDGISR
jgi:hypothetical protein